MAEGSDVYVPVSDINDIFDGRRGKPGLPWGNRILNLRADGWAAWKINADIRLLFIASQFFWPSLMMQTSDPGGISRILCRYV